MLLNLQLLPVSSLQLRKFDSLVQDRSRRCCGRLVQCLGRFEGKGNSNTTFAVLLVEVLDHCLMLQLLTVLVHDPGCFNEYACRWALRERLLTVAPPATPLAVVVRC
jgi:hypothetical protein